MERSMQQADTGVPGPPPLVVSSQEQHFPSLLPDWRRPVAPPPCPIPAGGALLLPGGWEGASVHEALTLCRVGVHSHEEDAAGPAWGRTGRAWSKGGLRALRSKDTAVKGLRSEGSRRTADVGRGGAGSSCFRGGAVLGVMIGVVVGRPNISCAS